MLPLKAIGHLKTLRSKFDAVDKAEVMRSGLDRIAEKALALSHRLYGVVERTKEEWRQWGLEQEQRHETWRRELAAELDAAMNKMDFDQAIRRYGFPVSHVMEGNRFVAIWENARIRYTPFVLSPYFHRIVPHGFRLRLTFDKSTRLCYWSYQEW